VVGHNRHRATITSPPDYHHPTTNIEAIIMDVEMVDMENQTPHNPPDITIL